MHHSAAFSSPTIHIILLRETLTTGDADRRGSYGEPAGGSLEAAGDDTHTENLGPRIRGQRLRWEPGMRGNHRDTPTNVARKQKIMC